jgi:hypothetical protein
MKERETLYTWAQLETAAIMWEYVVRELRRHREARNPWEEYRQAYGTVTLRCRVIRHAPDLFAAYEKALDNKYEKDFDRDFVSQYMEDHVTRILT